MHSAKDTFMKIKKLYFILAACSFASISCDKNEDIPLAKDYLPLDAGNYWQLDYSSKTEVDTSYYRIEDNKIIVKEGGRDEAVKFNLSAKVNDRWNYNSSKVVLSSKTDTIRIGNALITNCYNFYFDIPEFIDDEHSIWLAPGIGFIQEMCGECMHHVRKLDKARIGTQDIDF